MKTPLFTGRLVRLAAPNPETDVPVSVEWLRDSEFLRLEDREPARPWSAESDKKEWTTELEKDRADDFWMNIRTLAEDRFIGWVGLRDIQWTNGNAALGIGIGNRAYWGQGYGTDALGLMLRHAFRELNLHRISLGVFEYNTRALRCYEKAGFVIEGCQRAALLRDGRRWGILQMGILQEEWESKQ